MAPITSEAARGEFTLLRLLQLSSPALPIGAFAYSQGLEPAVAAGLVTDEASASAWILGLLAGPIAHLDLAIFARLHAAFGEGDISSADRWNAFLLASRATAEFQAEEQHLGAALARVLATLGIGDEPDGSVTDAREAQLRLAAPSVAPPIAPSIAAPVARTFARMFALATARWQIDARPAAEAFAFALAEAQTSAAVRLVPLGQSAGVRIHAAAAQEIPAAVGRALALGDDDIGSAAPMQALLSSVHETQYSRLFRS
jgi:urease accessory protein